MKKRIFVLLLILTLCLSSCTVGQNVGNGGLFITDDDSSCGDSPESMGVLDGVFYGDTKEGDYTVKCVAGSQGCYSVSGSTITFSGISSDTAYSISGKFRGNIVIDVAESYKFDLELQGFSIMSDGKNPITVLGGDEVSIKAINGTDNYIYDLRSVVNENDSTAYPSAIYSEVDLELAGKGSMYILSDNNGGVHTKDDLQVKNLTLTVCAFDTALKGNDSLSLENAVATIVSEYSDAIKTKNSNISEKGNQRGTVSIDGGSYNIFSAADGIDAAYDVVISGAQTKVNVYTDKYSNHTSSSAEVGRSTKGIKGDNSVKINGGVLNVKSNDNAIHSSTGTKLDNGEFSLGAITLNGGSLTVYTNADGLHADGELTLKDGSLKVINSREGIDGSVITIAGGDHSIFAKDDAIKSTTATGTAVTLSGGSVMIYCGGNGIDTATRTKGEGVVFCGADVVIVADSTGISAIETENGYSYSSGSLLAIMPSGNAANKSTNCSGFKSVGKTVNLSIKKGDYVTAVIGDDTVTVRTPSGMSALVVMLGSNSSTVTASQSSSYSLEEGQAAFE